MRFVEAHHFDLLSILIIDQNNKVLFTSEPVLNTEGLIWMINYQMPSVASFEEVVEIYVQQVLEWIFVIYYLRLNVVIEKVVWVE